MSELYPGDSSDTGGDLPVGMRGVPGGAPAVTPLVPCCTLDYWVSTESCETADADCQGDTPKVTREPHILLQSTYRQSCHRTGFSCHLTGSPPHPPPPSSPLLLRSPCCLT